MGWTYGGHKFENGELGGFEQLDDVGEGLDHGGVVADRAGHATGQAVAQSMVDVQLAWRAWSQEGIIQAYHC